MPLPEASKEDLQELCCKYKIPLDENEFKAVLGAINEEMKLYQIVDKLDDPIKQKGVVYNRNDVYRPKPEENPLNAWYYKCKIEGKKQGGILNGKTIAVKDNICLAWVPMMNGSKVIEGYVPEFDATVVERVLDAGATIVGKTACEDLCLSVASFNTTYGPVKNPWNQKYSTGGSSTGSAVVVAIGEADMAFGGDQCGSIRLPAGACGIVGLKPTHGLVPYTGAVPIEMTIDHLGPMTRTVNDAALMLEAIAGDDDGKDIRQPNRNFPVPKYSQELQKVGRDKSKIGILKEGFEECDPSVVKICKNAIDLLQKSGQFGDISEVSAPLHSEGAIIGWPVLVQGLTNQMFLGNGYGTGLYGMTPESLSEKMGQGYQCNSGQLSITAKYLIYAGLFANDKNFGFRLYAKGQTLSYQLRQQYGKILEKYDVMIMPTSNVLPAELPDEKTSMEEKIKRGLAGCRNTFPIDVTHNPAITINAGYDEKTGLPIGIMMVGRHFDEVTVLKAAKLAEDVLKPLQKPFPKI